MPSLSAVRAANTAVTFNYRPVALFVGGTSGIGQAMAQRFAHYTKGNAHIIICGRNKATAEKIIETLPRTSDSLYEFVECDASLMKNVVATTNSLKTRLATLNYLVLSAGYLSMDRVMTAEGLDESMALNSYSRWKFIAELIQLLEKAKEQGQEAKVESVHSAGLGKPLIEEDLGLKKGFTFLKRMGQSSVYNDIIVQDFAERYPNLSFTHIYPGVVNTPIFGRMPWIIRTIVSVTLMPLIAMSPETCAESMLYPLLSLEHQHGAFHLDEHADRIDPSKIFVTKEGKEKLVAHFTAATSGAS